MTDLPHFRTLASVLGGVAFNSSTLLYRDLSKLLWFNFGSLKQ